MASTLQDRLDAITARTRALVQANRLAVSEQANAELFASGIEDRILPVGSTAPSFALTGASTGQLVRSADLLALGPLVLSFFRGRWDPYCITELEAWRDLYPALRERGAFFVAISPQTRRQNDFAAQQHNLTFPILSDPGCTVAERFGIVHTVTPAARRYFQSILVNIPYANAGATYANAEDSAWRLPLPAVFLVRQDNTIAFAEGHADPRVRPEPDDILRLLG
jgi:peroxiredoxin